MDSLSLVAVALIDHITQRPYDLYHTHDKGKSINESREERVSMIGISELTMLAFLASVNVTANQSILTDSPALNCYQARSLDEQEIVELLFDYQNAYNSYDPVEVLSLYLPGAIIKAGMKDDWSEHIVTKEEYNSIIDENFSKRKMYCFILKLFIPKEVNLEKNTAKFIVPFITYSITQHYWEKGLFNFEFKKTDSGWLISKNIWEILDLHYSP